MEKKYIMALDAGTSSVRAIIFDKNGNTVKTAQQNLPSFILNLAG